MKIEIPDYEIERIEKELDKEYSKSFLEVLNYNTNEDFIKLRENKAILNLIKKSKEIRDETKK